MSEPIIVPEQAAWYVRVALDMALINQRKHIEELTSALAGEDMAGVIRLSLEGALEHTMQLHGEMKEFLALLPKPIRPVDLKPAPVPEARETDNALEPKDWADFEIPPAEAEELLQSKLDEILTELGESSAAAASTKYRHKLRQQAAIVRAEMEKLRPNRMPPVFVLTNGDARVHVSTNGGTRTLCDYPAAELADSRDKAATCQVCDAVWDAL